MTDTIRFFIVAFAVCLWWVVSTEAFAGNQVAQCFTSGTVTRCMMPNGEIVTIINR